MNKLINKTMKDRITELISDYNRKIDSVNKLLSGEKQPNYIARLKAKRSAFRTFIVELERLLIK